MLTGEAKRAYQREYMRKKRSNKVIVRPVGIGLTRSNGTDVRPADKQATLKRLRGAVGEIERGSLQSNSRGIKEESHTNLPPLYNSAIHRPGDRVRVMVRGKLREIVIPEIDADGQPIPVLT